MFSKFCRDIHKLLFWRLEYQGFSVRDQLTIRQYKTDGIILKWSFT